MNLVAAVCARRAREPLRHCAVAIQHGFVPGRQLSDNVADLGTAARVAAWRSSPNDAHCLVFLDLKAALPSLGHDYLWISVEGSGHPLGCRPRSRDCIAAGAPVGPRGTGPTCLTSTAASLRDARCPDGSFVPHSTRTCGGSQRSWPRSAGLRVRAPTTSGRCCARRDTWRSWSLSSGRRRLVLSSLWPAGARTLKNRCGMS